MSYLLSLLALAATCIALRGNTWNEKETGWRRLSVAGYLALAVAVLTCLLSAWQAHASARAAAGRRVEARQAMVELVQEIWYDVTWSRTLYGDKGGKAGNELLQRDMVQMGNRLGTLLQRYDPMLEDSVRSYAYQLQITLVEGSRLLPDYPRGFLADVDASMRRLKKAACAGLRYDPCQERIDTLTKYAIDSTLAPQPLTPVAP